MGRGIILIGLLLIPALSIGNLQNDLKTNYDNCKNLAQKPFPFQPISVKEKKYLYCPKRFRGDVWQIFGIMSFTPEGNGLMTVAYLGLLSKTGNVYQGIFYKQKPRLGDYAWQISFKIDKLTQKLLVDANFNVEAVQNLQGAQIINTLK